MMQARSILAILDAAGRDLLIERMPNGRWRVATEQTAGEEGYTCDGSDLTDALGQVTQVLALELGIDPHAVEGAKWTHDDIDDVDAPAPVTLEGPVEFCPAIPQVDARGRFTVEYSEAWTATHDVRESVRVVNE